jgi:hypothetical protein
LTSIVFSFRHKLGYTSSIPVGRAPTKPRADQAAHYAVQETFGLLKAPKADRSGTLPWGYDGGLYADSCFLS